MSTVRALVAFVCLCGAIAAAPAVAAAPASATQRAASVVAVIGDSGVDLVHADFALPAGQRPPLPPGAAEQAVRVQMPRGGSADQRREALRRGPLGKPRPNTLYHLVGTRLLLWTGTQQNDLLAGDAHGTGTASAAAGRAHGGSPGGWVLVTTGFADESWNYAASQPWIDTASGSVFEPVGPGPSPLCEDAAGIARLRASGRLVFVAAGNGPVDTAALPAGAHPAAIRVGGVREDGTSALPRPDGPTSYSARAYDLAESYTNRVAENGTEGGYRDAKGTSGSSPKAAGRVADVLARVRAEVGDGGTGTRAGALVVATDKRPARGPLSDGRLSADELEAAVLAAAVPSAQVPAGRYAVEGYGWFGPAAQARALDFVLGRAAPPARPEDDTARAAAKAARSASVAARGCRT